MMIIIGNSMYYNHSKSTKTMALTLLCHNTNKYNLVVDRINLTLNPVINESLRNFKTFIFG